MVDTVTPQPDDLQFSVTRNIESNKYGNLIPASDHEHFGIIENWLGENCVGPFHVTKTGHEYSRVAGNWQNVNHGTYQSSSMTMKYYQSCTMTVEFDDLSDYTKCSLKWR